jgi:ribosomal protein S15P/S13E
MLLLEPGAPPVIKAGPPVKKGTALDAERKIALAGGLQLFQQVQMESFTQQIQTLQKHFKTR